MCPGLWVPVTFSGAESDLGLEGLKATGIEGFSVYALSVPAIQLLSGG